MLDGDVPTCVSTAQRKSRNCLARPRPSSEPAMDKALNWPEAIPYPRRSIWCAHSTSLRFGTGSRRLNVGTTPRRGKHARACAVRWPMVGTSSRSRLPIGLPSAYACRQGGGVLTVTLELPSPAAADYLKRFEIATLAIFSLPG